MAGQKALFENGFIMNRRLYYECARHLFTARFIQARTFFGSLMMSAIAMGMLAFVDFLGGGIRIIEKGTVIAYIIVNLGSLLGLVFFGYLAYRAAIYHRELAKQSGCQDRFFNTDPQKRNLAMEVPYASRFFDGTIEAGREGALETVRWEDIARIRKTRHFYLLILKRPKKARHIETVDITIYSAVIVKKGAFSSGDWGGLKARIRETLPKDIRLTRKEWLH